MGELFGSKLTAAQRRAAEREAEELLNQWAYGAGGPPSLLEASGHVFEWLGWGPTQPKDWHLCGIPPRLRQDDRRRKEPHNCWRYRDIGPGRIASAREWTRQDAPPPPPPPRTTPDSIAAAYAALELQPGATQTEIRAAFAAIARRNHPDLNPGDAAAETRMKEASAAYNLLKR